MFFDLLETIFVQNTTSRRVLAFCFCALLIGFGLGVALAWIPLEGIEQTELVGSAISIFGVALGLLWMRLPRPE